MILASPLLAGLAVGFLVAANHIGPTCLLCVRHTMKLGARAGLAAGLGSALIHAVYAVVAGAGLLWAVAVPGLEPGLRLLGAGVLLFFGVQALREKSKEHDHEGESCAHHHAFLSVVTVELARIGEIAGFVAMIAGLGAAISSLGDAAALGIGAFVGSAVWWAIVVAVVSALREKLSPTVLAWFTRVSGVVLILLAVMTAAGVETELHLGEHGAEEVHAEAIGGS